MRSVVSFHVYSHRLPGGAKRLLETTGCGTDVAQVERIELDEKRVDETIAFLFDASDPRIDKVLTIVHSHDEEPIVVPYYEFTEEERQTAPLLVMDQDVNENVVGGAVEGTKYDLATACPNCGTGVRQASPLYIFYKQLQMVRNHRAIGSDRGAILLDGGMVKKLRDANVTGIGGFGEVYARMKNGGRSLVAREQIFIDHTLPPESPNAQFDRSTACHLCGRAGMKTVGGPPWRTVYRRQDLNDTRDFNVSWEWTGTFALDKDPRKNDHPSPATLVTPKVMNIFREAGVTTFEWTPIFVED